MANTSFMENCALGAALSVADRTGMLHQLRTGAATGAELAKALGLDGAATTLTLEILSLNEIIEKRDERGQLLRSTGSKTVPSAPGNSPTLP